MPYLDLDIETIPTQAPGARERIAADIRPPATHKKPETIAKWEAEEKPAAIDKAYRDTSLKGGYCHIVSIAWAWDEGDVITVLDGMPTKAQTANYKDFLAFERAFLNAVLRAIEADVERRYPIVAGHCVAFDVRTVAQRAMVLGVRLPVWWPHRCRPWDEARLFCTSQRWTGSDRKDDRISLDELCRILGIPGKGDVDGSQVYDLWCAGRLGDIAAYCCDDVRRAQVVRRRLLGAEIQAPPVVASPPAAGDPPIEEPVPGFDDASGELVADGDDGDLFEDGTTRYLREVIRETR